MQSGTRLNQKYQKISRVETTAIVASFGLIFLCLLYADDPSARMFGHAAVALGIALTFLLFRTIRKEEARRDLLSLELEKLSEEREKIAEKLAIYTRALENSNRDLEEFAYVASHDLQEPLRMVSSYMHLISTRYGPKLDQDGQEFMTFAVDGAKRMQLLIQDLLAFARLKRTGSEFTEVDLNSSLNKALTELALPIRETSAQISVEPLPKVFANPRQIQQLFQNLIANSLKFRSERPLVIRVSARTEGNSPCIVVSDNGIGVEKQFTERIFVLFQRLHNREDFPGSGIGLAICRRIVGVHGGNIWADPNFDHGLSVSFTLPQQKDV